jgi:hypothetical protein
MTAVDGLADVRFNSARMGLDWSHSPGSQPRPVESKTVNLEDTTGQTPIITTP